LTGLLLFDFCTATTVLPSPSLSPMPSLGSSSTTTAPVRLRTCRSSRFAFVSSSFFSCVRLSRQLCYAKPLGTRWSRRR
jgi:hypothetical protein